MTDTYWLERDSEGVVDYEAMHGGDGAIRLAKGYTLGLRPKGRHER